MNNYLISYTWQGIRRTEPVTAESEERALFILKCNYPDAVRVKVKEME